MDKDNLCRCSLYNIFRCNLSQVYMFTSTFQKTFECMYVVGNLK